MAGYFYVRCNSLSKFNEEIAKAAQTDWHMHDSVSIESDNLYTYFGVMLCKGCKIHGDVTVLTVENTATRRINVETG